jgi:hypothetical protein
MAWSISSSEPVAGVATLGAKLPAFNFRFGVSEIFLGTGTTIHKLAWLLMAALTICSNCSVLARTTLNAGISPKLISYQVLKGSYL